MTEELGNLLNKNTLYDYVVITDSRSSCRVSSRGRIRQEPNYSSEVPHFRAAGAQRGHHAILVPPGAVPRGG